MKWSGETLTGEIVQKDSTVERAHAGYLHPGVSGVSDNVLFVLLCLTNNYLPAVIGNEFVLQAKD